MSYFLSMIIMISSYSHSTISEPVDIGNTDYKLSSEVVYNIYNADTGSYLFVGKDSETVYFGQPKGEWKIEKQKWGSFALKNVDTGKYLSHQGGNMKMISAPSAYARSDMGLKASRHIFEETIKDLATIELWTRDGNYRLEAWKMTELLVLCEKDTWMISTSGAFSVGGMMIAGKGGLPCPKTFRQIFIPKSVPPRCESITSTKPDAFKKLSMTIDQSTSLEYKNEGASEHIYTSNKREATYIKTTSFTSKSGSEQTFGFTIGYESPKIDLFGSFSADYHMDWKYYQENTKESTQTKEIKQTMQTEVKCPARSTCRRHVMTYKPSSNKIPVTVTAICDGITYIVNGEANVDGVVQIKVVDQPPEPLDCEYYTNEYGNIGKGKLPFCDTCIKDTECELCRDGYILLDGQCITAHHCENTCGGEVKGDGAEGRDDKIPWSGGWCQIGDDESKYNSKECGDVVGRK